MNREVVPVESFDSLVKKFSEENIKFVSLSMKLHDLDVEHSGDMPVEGISMFGEMMTLAIKMDGILSKLKLMDKERFEKEHQKEKGRMLELKARIFDQISQFKDDGFEITISK